MLDELKSHFCRFTALENLYMSKNPQSFAAGEKWLAASRLKVHANMGLSLKDTALINAEGVRESGAVVAVWRTRWFGPFGRGCAVGKLIFTMKRNRDLRGLTCSRYLPHFP